MDRLYTTLRGRNALINVFELWVALAGIISGLVYFIQPETLRQNSIAAELGENWAMIWSWSYFAAGVGVVYGLLRPSPRIEVAALCILGTSTFVNGVAIFSIFGARSVATAITLITLATAAWVRAYLVYRAVIRLSEEYANGRG